MFRKNLITISLFSFGIIGNIPSISMADYTLSDNGLTVNVNVNDNETVDLNLSREDLLTVKNINKRGGGI